MARDSKIEWCDHTYNPWVGCQKVSDGCTFCYAERDMTRKPRWANAWGPPETSERVRTKTWGQPISWNRQAELEGKRYKVFCASLADIFEDNPQVVEWRRELWQLIESTPFLDWLLLTKRPENIEHMLPSSWMSKQFPRNVWLGFSASNQNTFNARMPDLERFAYRSHPIVIFVSLEPLLGPVDLHFWLGEMADADYGEPGCRALDWVIVGGESGRAARAICAQWVKNIRDQCAVAGTAFHFKQWGAWFPRSQWEDNPDLTLPDDCDCIDGPNLKIIDGDVMHHVGKGRAGRLLDGRTWDQMPT